MYQSISGLTDPDELITCPYCQPPKTHQLRYKRLNIHLTEMKKKDHSYKGMVQCIFNAKHLIPSAEYNHHLITCPDRGGLERDLLYEQELAEKEEEDDDEGKFSSVVNHHIIESTEDWDAEPLFKKDPFRLDKDSSREFTKPSATSQSFNSSQLQDDLRQPKTTPFVLIRNNAPMGNSRGVGVPPARPILAGYGRGVSTVNSTNDRDRVPGRLAENNQPIVKSATITPGFSLAALGPKGSTISKSVSGSCVSGSNIFPASTYGTSVVSSSSNGGMMHQGMTNVPRGYLGRGAAGFTSSQSVPTFPSNGPPPGFSHQTRGAAPPLPPGLSAVQFSSGSPCRSASSSASEDSCSSSDPQKQIRKLEKKLKQIENLEKERERRPLHSEEAAKVACKESIQTELVLLRL